MKAFIHALKAHLTDDGWVHPRTGTKLGGVPENVEVFCLFAADADTGRELVCFVVDRTTLEQLRDNIDNTLSIDPVRIRRAA